MQDEQTPSTNEQDNQQPEYLTKDTLLEVLTPLIKNIQDSQNKALNSFDKRYKTEISNLSSILDSIKGNKDESTEQQADEQQPQQGKLTIAALQKEFNEKLAAKDRESQEKYDKLIADLNTEKENTKAQQRKVFEATLRGKVTDKFTKEGFEDVSDAVDVFFYCYNQAGFVDDNGSAIYKPSEETEAETIDSLVDKYKQSSKGKRFIPSTTTAKGTGLPSKSSDTVVTKPTEKDPKQDLLETFNKLKQGQIQIGYNDR